MTSHIWGEALSIVLYGYVQIQGLALPRRVAV